MQHCRVAMPNREHFQHRIAAYTAPDPVLNYLGFDVGGAQQLVAWEIRLTSEGIAVIAASLRETGV
jgi:hypothetical protein